MKRTTVMLPEELHERATRRARQRGVSLGELIRVSLDAVVPNDSYDSENDPLFEDVVFDGPVPSDLSKDHDAYLYDGKK